MRRCISRVLSSFPWHRWPSCVGPLRWRSDSASSASAWARRSTDSAARSSSAIWPYRFCSRARCFRWRADCGRPRAATLCRPNVSSHAVNDCVARGGRCRMRRIGQNMPPEMGRAACHPNQLSLLSWHLRQGARVPAMVYRPRPSRNTFLLLFTDRTHRLSARTQARAGPPSTPGVGWRNGSARGGALPVQAPQRQSAPVASGHSNPKKVRASTRRRTDSPAGTPGARREP